MGAEASLGRRAGTVVRWPAISTDIRCGRCDTRATAASWSSTSRVTSRARQARTRSTTVAVAVALLRRCGVTTQVRSTNRSASAVTGPECCEPAIGCDPT